ncbi:SAP domain-containing protein [Winogradskyella sp. SM1960]|uniref:SAP domain-containing protein n=1 Tax=Winogradskyella sp. SM1960 TaxID=2865955 RepID=UPI001CD333D9|nr:SAP domain-containing protein [Winogradskyella sp. SM1960]
MKEKLGYQHWLKFELIEFCKKNELCTQGNKIQLKERIEAFFDKRKKNEMSNALLKNKRRTIKKI